jgi:dephospho-CoA kinase
MLAVGLTGGIGSGKSTVARLMVERGAVLIDADAIAREVVEPGGAAYQPLVERFGQEILHPDGTIDRQALASRAFADKAALEALNAVTHPAIGALMLERRKQQEGRDVVVLLDIPLLKPVHRELLDLDVVVVVDCPVDTAVERLVGQRGFDRADAEARVGAQMKREERMAGADVVLDNSGDLDALTRQVHELWERLTKMESGTGPGS